VSGRPTLRGRLLGDGVLSFSDPQQDERRLQSSIAVRQPRFSGIGILKQGRASTGSEYGGVDCMVGLSAFALVRQRSRTDSRHSTPDSCGHFICDGVGFSGVELSETWQCCRCSGQHLFNKFFHFRSGFYSPQSADTYNLHLFNRGSRKIGILHL
jgi:hypothetical protein